MTFTEWKSQLAIEFCEVFGMTPHEAESYIQDTGDACWRAAFDDGVTPAEAAAEEAWAAMWSNDND